MRLIDKALGLPGVDTPEHPAAQANFVHADGCEPARCVTESVRRLPPSTLEASLP